MKMHQKGFKSQGIIVRKNPKDYGTSKIIEGLKLPKVIILEFRRSNKNRKNNTERNRKNKREWY
jgi:hypothetical protein